MSFVLGVALGGLLVYSIMAFMEIRSLKNEYVSAREIEETLSQIVDYVKSTETTVTKEKSKGRK